jgi:hypothetical protein
METEPSNTKEQITTYLYFCTLYLILVGILTLWGYWSTFGINILEFISLFDIIKLTAYPIALIFLILSTFFTLGFYVGNVIPTPSEPLLKRETRSFLLRIKSVFIAGYILGISAIFLQGAVDNFFILSILIALPITLIVEKKKLFSQLFKQESLRAIFVFVLVVLPLFNLGYGAFTAKQIITGKLFFYLVPEIQDSKIKTTTELLQYKRYIGQAGDFLFLLDPINDAVIIMKIGNSNSIVLKHYPQSLIADYQPATLPTRHP